MKLLLDYAVTLKVEPAGGVLTEPPVLTEPEFDEVGGFETDPELLDDGVEAVALTSGVEAEIVITTDYLGTI